MDINSFANALLCADFDLAHQILVRDIPDKLIKYIALFDEKKEPSRNKKRFSTLKNEEMWISSIQALNDPFEFKSIYIDQNWCTTHGFPMEIINKFRESIDYSQNYGVSCLSSCSNIYNLPMWAYYANNHSGFCVEYEVENKEHIREVLYEPARIDVTRLLLHLIEKFKALPQFSTESEAMEYFKENENQMMDEKRIGLLFLYSMFIKSTQWEHEKEYRVLFDAPNKNISLKSIGIKTCRIIGGYNCSEEHMQRLNDISKNLGCGNAYQMKLDDTHFEIKDVRL